jgi:DNA-binding MarR family transcriptional regulator
MQKRGLVTRESHSSDARGAVIVLTESGWKEIRRAAPLHIESVRRHFIDLLDRTQLEILGDVSDTIVSHLNDQRQG